MEIKAIKRKECAKILTFPWKPNFDSMHVATSEKNDDKMTKLNDEMIRFLFNIF